MTGGAVCSAALVGMMHTMSGRHAAERVYLSEDSRVILDCNTLLAVVIRLASHKMVERDQALPYGCEQSAATW